MGTRAREVGESAELSDRPLLRARKAGARSLQAAAESGAVTDVLLRTRGRERRGRMWGVGSRAARAHAPMVN